MTAERDAARQTVRTTQSQVTLLIAKRDTARQTSRIAQAHLTSLTAERDALRFATKGAQASANRLQRLVDGTSLEDYMREVACIGEKIEFYRARYYDAIPSE